MVEKFIERGTDYQLKNGKLSVYETNCACRDIKFYFDHFVITIMVAGHKTIVTNNLKFEFFPGTLFIPERETINSVSIPNATINSPTKCLVLELRPSYIQSFYEEVLCSEVNKKILYDELEESTCDYFFSNEELLIKAFKRLYDHQLQRPSPTKEMIDDLIIKEMLLRIFNTEGGLLLKRNFEKSISEDSIRKAIHYIHHNIQEKLTAQKLAKVSGLGQTTFFKKFKACTGSSPIDYILNERIRQSKIMISKNQLNLQEIAYQCGFNSYEYFCSSFKKIEHLKPTEFKKSLQSAIFS